MFLQCKPSLLWLFLHLENRRENKLGIGSYLLNKKIRAASAVLTGIDGIFVLSS